MDILTHVIQHNTLPDLLGGGFYHLSQEDYNNLSGFTNSNYVHTFGDEYISGDKTFYNNIYISGTSWLTSVSATTVSANTFYGDGSNLTGIESILNNTQIGFGNSSNILTGSTALTYSYLNGIGLIDSQLNKIVINNEFYIKNTIESPAGDAYAINFNGVDQYSLAPITFNNTACSIEFWAKRNSSASQKGLFQWADNLNSSNPVVYIQDNAGIIGVYVNGAYRFSGISLPNDVWTHFVLTWSSTVWNFYVNGTPQTPYTGTYSYVGSGVYFGNGYDGYWNGSIDEARVYSYELNQSEVTASYNSGNGTYGSAVVGLSAAWHFDEGVGISSVDYSTNGYTNVLYNGVSWVPGKVIQTSTQSLVKGFSFKNTIEGGSKGQVILGDTDSYIRLNQTDRTFYFRNLSSEETDSASAIAFNFSSNLSNSSATLFNLSTSGTTKFSISSGGNVSTTGYISATTFYGNLNWNYITNSSHTHDDRYYTQSQSNANFLSASTNSFSSLTVTSLTASTETIISGLTINSFASASEKIITTSGSGELQNYLQTDTQFITNSTLITDLLSEGSWYNNIYSGTTTSAVEGQMYIGPKYLYIYQNSMFNRFNISRDNTTVFTGTTYIQTIQDNIITSSCLSATTIQLLSASTFKDFNLYIKNIQNVSMTVLPATIDTIDGLSSFVLGANCGINLYTDGSNWYVLNYINNYTSLTASTARINGDFTVTGNTSLQSLSATTGQFGTIADNTTFEPDGTLTFNGAATVWDDIRIVSTAFDFSGATDPKLVQYKPGGGSATMLYEFAKNDIAYFVVQIPHSYKQGTDISVHIHWTPGSRGTSESGNTVGWKVQYTWANIEGTFSAMATADLSDACDGTNDKHQMTPAVALTGTNKTISSMLICQITRTDTGTDDTWVSTTSGQLPLLLEVDFHYEIDTIGSRTTAAK